ncbi:uncharacterized protein V1518DRAFT_421440 [Limtongia smithiae]|uniref:uncharacterized protein n=1 Tax=Limtongia smithiae TaxID=1125753 RepID=UPI0034CF69F3
MTFAALSKHPFALRPRVVIVGGSIGGLSIAKFLTSTISADASKGPMPRITVIEPRHGIMNPIAIPRSLVEPDFAKHTFATLSSFPNDMIDNVEYVRGKVVHMSASDVSVEFADDSADTAKIPFDYAVLATGRHRQSYIMPPEPTKEEYIEVMNSYVNQIRNAQNIVIVGGGAVGIEIAGEIMYEYPDKNVTLLHSRATLPPEPVDAAVGEYIVDALVKLGVNLQLSTRAKSDTDGKVTTTDGREFKSDLTIWCNSRGKAATGFLDQKTFIDSIDANTGAAKINDDMSLKGFPHIFAIGDVNDFPVIKTAGGAHHQANTATQNLLRAMDIKRGTYTESDAPASATMTPWGAHMALIIGQELGVMELTGRGVVSGTPVLEHFGGDMHTSKMWSVVGIKTETPPKRHKL